MQRLNPKLTQRRPAPPPLPPSNTSIAPGGIEENELFERLKAQSESKTELLHTGTWKRAEYSLGRPVPRTGVWDCCGNREHLSMYCIVPQSQYTFHSVINNVPTSTSETLLEGSAARAAYENYIRQEEEELKELRLHNSYMKKFLEQAKLANGPPLNENSNDDNQSSSIIDDNEEKDALEKDFKKSAENAPMLISWIYKNVEQEPTVILGMKLLEKHLESSEGCKIMEKHGVITTLVHVHQYYKNHPPLQKSVISCLRQLLLCNFTRDNLINKSVDPLKIGFGVAHRYMNSKSHVEDSLQCMLQCSRSENCRSYIFQHHLISYVIHISKKYPKTPGILRSMLKMFNWSTTTTDRMLELYRLATVPLSIHCMQKHPYDPDVLAPAMVFLTRIANIVPDCLENILSLKAIPLVISALKALYSFPEIQLAGLKMLQTLSKTREGWDQITSTQGGWQSLTQGTTLGDALIHDLPGALNNPGWCIGETPHLPEMEKLKQQAAQIALKKTRARSKGHWTSTVLREYMGFSSKGQRLAINNEYYDTFFELVETLDLLPFPGEEREYWFIRIKEYEKESDIKLDEMVNTISEMRKRELKKAKEEASNTFNGEYVKPVFVNGQQITSAYLQENDKSVQETLEGVI